MQVTGKGERTPEYSGVDAKNANNVARAAPRLRMKR